MPVARNPTGPPQKCTYVFFQSVVSYLLLPPTSHTCFFYQWAHLIVHLMIPALRVGTWPSCHSSAQTCSQVAHRPLLHLCFMLFLPLLPLSLMPLLSSIKNFFSAFSVHSIQTCFRVSHLRKKSYVSQPHILLQGSHDFWAIRLPSGTSCLNLDSLPPHFLVFSSSLPSLASSYIIPLKLHFCLFPPSPVQLRGFGANHTPMLIDFKFVITTSGSWLCPEATLFLWLIYTPSSWVFYTFSWTSNTFPFSS